VTSRARKTSGEIVRQQGVTIEEANTGRHVQELGRRGRFVEGRLFPAPAGKRSDRLGDAGTVRYDPGRGLLNESDSWRGPHPNPLPSAAGLSYGRVDAGLPAHVQSCPRERGTHNPGTKSEKTAVKPQRQTRVLYGPCVRRTTG
jgi:hypothetical protein